MHQFLFKAKFSSSLHNFVLKAQPTYRQLDGWRTQLYSVLLISPPSGSLLDCIYTAIILETLLLNQASFWLSKERTSNMNFLLWPRNLLLRSALTPRNPFSFNPEIPAQNINVNFSQNFTHKLNMRNEPEDVRWKSNTMNTEEPRVFLRHMHNYE